MLHLLFRASPLVGRQQYRLHRQHQQHHQQCSLYSARAYHRRHLRVGTDVLFLNSVVEMVNLMQRSNLPRNHCQLCPGHMSSIGTDGLVQWTHKICLLSELVEAWAQNRINQQYSHQVLMLATMLIHRPIPHLQRRKGAPRVHRDR